MLLQMTMRGCTAAGAGAVRGCMPYKPGLKPKRPSHSMHPLSNPFRAVQSALVHSNKHPIFASHPPSCPQAFARLDSDNDGVISRRELISALAASAEGSGADGDASGGGGNPRDVDEILRELDVDGDGRISYDEFLAMMQQGA